MTIWRSMAVAVLFLAGAGVSAPAQGQARTGPPNPRMQQTIAERFARHVQTELNLTETQSIQVRRILMTSAERRRGMENEERQAQRALREQLRPGVAAQADSLSRLIDQLTSLRVAAAQAAKDEIRELGAVLSPVQQAQFLIMRDRLQAAAQGIRMQRRPAGPARDGPR